MPKCLTLPASISSLTAPATSSIGTSGFDAVLVEQVDRVDSQPPQRRVGDLLDVLGPAGQAGLIAVVVERETELGRDHHLARNGASASPTSSSLTNGP